jgi:LacI family transcriptional regulator
MAQRVTLEDIARQSGVSLATVSLVLREKPGINQETRRRVLEIARALGYQRKTVIEPALLDGTQMVGVIVKSRAGDLPQTNQFYAPVLAGIELACRKQQINMLYATVPVDEDNNPVDMPRMLQADLVDGLLLVGAFVDTTIARLIRHDAVPTVLVDAYAADNGYDSVITDNFRGAYQAVAHLIKLGHRYVGIAGSLPHTYPSIMERRRGALQALKDHELAAGHFADCHLDHNEAAEAVNALLRRSPEVTALFCCNDLTALGALQAAAALGRRVPDELALVGFDDIDLAAHITPSLTTMRVDKLSMGRLAIQLLANRIETPSASVVTAVLRPDMVERQSARPPGVER